MGNDNGTGKDQATANAEDNPIDEKELESVSGGRGGGLFKMAKKLAPAVGKFVGGLAGGGSGGDSGNNSSR
jgi:bacteriocin-like protein